MKPGNKQSDQDQRQQTTQNGERRTPKSDPHGNGSSQPGGKQYREETRRGESPSPKEDERGGNDTQGRAGKAIVHPDDEYVSDPQEETAQRTNR